MRVLTWNISTAPGCRNKSAKAPESWTEEGNLERIEQEVLRWGADVVALQECPSERPLKQLVTKYVLVGAHDAHAGYVHLYARRGVELQAETGVPGPGVVAVMPKRLHKSAMLKPYWEIPVGTGA